MQIHEITLREAAPRVPVKTGLAQRAQTRNAPGPASKQPTPAVPQPALTQAEKLAQLDAAEMEKRRIQAGTIPGAGPMTQALGSFIANKIGPRGLPSQRVQQAQTQPQAQPTATTTSPVTATTPQVRASATPPVAAKPQPQTFPPITIGNPKDPKATVYINKGQGYIDSKTGKPIPPAILKAMGPV